MFSILCSCSVRRIPTTFLPVGCFQGIISFINKNRNNNKCSINIVPVRTLKLTDANEAKNRSGKRRHAKALALKREYDNTNPDDFPSYCVLCPHRNPGIEVDYKNVRLLSQFVSSHTGMIQNRHMTKLCPRKQEEIRLSIERSRKVGLMPSTM